jgi:hypothetical protein
MQEEKKKRDNEVGANYDKVQQIRKGGQLATLKISANSEEIHAKYRTQPSSIAELKAREKQHASRERYKNLSIEEKQNEDAIRCDARSLQIADSGHVLLEPSPAQVAQSEIAKTHVAEANVAEPNDMIVEQKTASGQPATSTPENNTSSHFDTKHAVVDPPMANENMKEVLEADLPDCDDKNAQQATDPNMDPLDSNREVLGFGDSVSLWSGHQVGCEFLLSIISLFVLRFIHRFI